MAEARQIKHKVQSVSRREKTNTSMLCTIANQLK